MVKGKRYFCLIELGFIAKKKNELRYFYSSISLIFYLISKIYFKQYDLGVIVQINLSFFFFIIFSITAIIIIVIIVIIIIIIINIVII